MDYSLKANLYYKGVAYTPCDRCLKCPFKNKKPVIPIWEKTKKCFEKCPYDIIIWILTLKQIEIYEKFRSPKEKERDLKRAVSEGKISQVPEIKGALITTAPSFYFATFLVLKYYT